jgi:hypothetical protein
MGSLPKKRAVVIPLVELEEYRRHEPTNAGAYRPKGTRADRPTLRSLSERYGITIPAVRKQVLEVAKRRDPAACAAWVDRARDFEARAAEFLAEALKLRRLAGAPWRGGQ